MAGLERPFGRDRTKSNFWYDARTQIATALIDLQLFIEAANDNPQADIRKVINPLTLQPILVELLPWRDRADSNKARIAYLLIERGFEYLQNNQDSYVSDSLNKQIIDAIDLGKLLAYALLPQSERYGFRFDQLGPLSEEDNE